MVGKQLAIRFRILVKRGYQRCSRYFRITFEVTIPVAVVTVVVVAWKWLAAHWGGPE